MAAGSSSDGCFHTARAAADDENIFLLFGRLYIVAHTEFTSGPWIDGALEMLSGTHAGQTIEASQTRIDICALSKSCFFRPVRIRNQRTGHADNICTSFGQNLFSHLRIGDRTDGDNR